MHPTRHTAARAALAVLLAAVSAGTPALARSGAAAAAPLVVGTTNAPPFAFKDEKGEWTGISITLLQGLSKEIERDYRLEERPFRDLLDGVADGTLSVAPGTRETGVRAVVPGRARTGRQHGTDVA